MTSLIRATIAMLLLCCIFNLRVHAQLALFLYDDKVPNSIVSKSDNETWSKGADSTRVVTKVSIPTLTVMMPERGKEDHSAVIIVPGGGYSGEVFDKEGTYIGDCFARHGVTAFVLKYRLPSDATMRDKSYGPIQDAQQAILFLRSHAKDYSIDPAKIGIMGFSAGGHLAAMAGTQFDTAYVPNPAHVNLRPDFMVLVYPVISMTDALTHAGSRERLLGGHPTAARIQQFSNELHVTPRTPPTWITYAEDDSTVSVQNALVFYQALIAQKVPAEMHLFPKGGHGFVLGQPTDEWMRSIFTWMHKGGWME